MANVPRFPIRFEGTAKGKKLYGHLALARISNCPTIVSNVLAGMALAGGTLSASTICLIAIAMGMFYTAGMYLNDILDYSFDCRERPERPLPSGIVSLSAARTVMMMLFLIGILLLGAFGLYPLLSGLALLTLIVCYNRWHKHNPLSPLFMALCRCMVYVTAFLACSSYPGPVLFLPVSLIGLYIASLTFLAKVGRTIGQLIAGISLLDALVLVMTGNLPGTILSLVAFALTLFLQRYIRGT